MSESNQQPTVSELAEAHLLGLLKDDQVDALNELLLRDAQARKHCALAFEAMSMVHEEFRRREENAEIHADEPLLKDFDSVFSDLLLMEQNAEVVVVDEPFERKKPARQRAGETASLSLRDYVSVGGYVLRKAATSKPAIHAGLGAAVAAVLLLGLFLFNPFASNAPDTIADATNTTAPSIDEPISPTSSVATLTATHNATWAEGASAPGSLTPGSKLHPNQRLTLTAGFAEITTNRGAIAIIEAPATIQLTDNDNALRLHTGKLVGICETDSSKGFLVRTPHMDVTDLGTEFGVHATRNKVTTTVFTGEVTLTTPGGEPQHLTTDQTAKVLVNGNNRRLVVQDQPANGFNRLQALALTKTITLPGTGQAIAVGQADPNWRITAIDGKALPQSVAATVADPASFTTTNRANMRFMPNTSASRWVAPLPNYKTEQSVTYQTTFDVSGFDLQTVALDLKFLADKQVAEITLNGRPVEVPAHGSGPAFIEMTELVIREGFVEGPNTLSLTVQRYRTPEGDARFWTGLRTELELTGRRLGAGPNE